MAGAIEKSERVLEPWEKRVDVLRNLLGDKTRQVLTTDELRNAIENLGEDAYKDQSYYERWMAALMNILKDKGVVTQDEIDQRMTDIRIRLGLDHS
jgi:nitrile hydratase subunit beta